MENSNYIAEAFQKLSLVEDDFNISADVDNVNDLRSYIADDVELPAEEKIIDVAAEEEDDLQDNYVGKVILECSCCHTRIYKDLSEVVIDDETNLANIEELCPVCNTNSGFNVIGKIEAFKSENELPEEEPAETELPTDDLSDEVIEEAFKGLKEAYVKESVSDDISEAINEVTVKTDDGEATVNAEEDGKVTVDLSGAGVEEAVEEPVESITPLTDEEEADIEANGAEAPTEEEVPAEDELVDLEEPAEEDELVDLEEPAEEESEEEEVEESLNESKLDEESIADKVRANLSDKLANADVPAEDKVEDPDAKKVKQLLNDKVKANIAKTNQVDEDCELHEENLADKVRANLLRKLNVVDEPESFEENFNKLGTAYLKRVYENVNDFKMSSVNTENGALVVEGLINFASGNKKSTKFVFENKKTTAKGAIVYSGMNEMFSSSKNAFTLRGKTVDGAYIPESMIYRYNTNILNENNSSEVFKVCGRVIVK